MATAHLSIPSRSLTTQRKTITATERLQLIGLLTLAKRYSNMLDEIAIAATEITGESHSEFGHTADAVYEHHDVDKLLRKIG